MNSLQFKARLVSATLFAQLVVGVCSVRAPWASAQAASDGQATSSARALVNNSGEAYEPQDRFGAMSAGSGQLAPDCGDPVPGCGDNVCECGTPNCMLNSHICEDSFIAGAELVVLQPRFQNNTAFTVTDSDGTSMNNISDTDFDYKLDLSPRVFLGWRRSDGVGVRSSWWQFNHEASDESANPPANGFGRISPPPFDNIDISTTIPTDTVKAASDLHAYTIDLEATKVTQFCDWELGVGGGVRYASIAQSYSAQTIDSNNTLRGQIDFGHSTRGIGPTISLDIYKPISCQTCVYVRSRGSLLFGDGESKLQAGEDLDLATPTRTTTTTGGNDLLSIAEIQLGVRWTPPQRHCQVWRPFVLLAFEGQIWNGAGTSSSENGDLGFVGFNAGAGTLW